jgi:putative CRISPR-associated protein (TIGR02620 family)
MTNNSNIVIITRHPGLVQVLHELAPETIGAPILDRADPSQIQGKHVYGVLPLTLACLASKVTNVTLNVPQELRGMELTAEQVREFMTELETFEVTKVA